MKTVQTTMKTTNDINAVMKNMGNFQGKFNLDKSGFDPNMPGHKTVHDMVLRQQPRTVKKEGAEDSSAYMSYWMNILNKPQNT